MKWRRISGVVYDDPGDTMGRLPTSEEAAEADRAVNAEPGAWYVCGLWGRSVMYFTGDAIGPCGHDVGGPHRCNVVLQKTSRLDGLVRECPTPEMAVLVERCGKVGVPFSYERQTWYVCRDGTGAYLSQRINADALACIDLPWGAAAVRTSMISTLKRRVEKAS